MVTNFSKSYNSQLSQFWAYDFPSDVLVRMPLMASVALYLFSRNILSTSYVSQKGQPVLDNIRWMPLSGCSCWYTAWYIGVLFFLLIFLNSVF